MAYRMWNGPMPTTAAQVAVTTGATIKTLLQIKPFIAIRLLEWRISFDGYSAAQPIKCELLETGTVFGTVTAAVDADISRVGSPSDQVVASTAGITLGTSATGYTCTSEGSIVASRVFDAEFVAPTNQYVNKFDLLELPLVSAGSALRIRVTAPVAVNALCSIKWELA